MSENKQRFINLVNDTIIYCACVNNKLAPYEAGFLRRRVQEVADALSAYFYELAALTDDLDGAK